MTNRELKFKALRIDYKTGSKIWVYYGLNNKPILSEGEDWLSTDLQFLGKDGYGNDVYEDDIVLVDIWNWNQPKAFRVYFDDNNMGYFPFNETWPSAEGDQRVNIYSSKVVGTYAEDPKKVSGSLKSPRFTEEKEYLVEQY